MSQNLGALERPITNGEKRSILDARVPILVVGLAAVAILAVLVTILVPGSNSAVDPIAAPTSLSANPELIVWMRTMREAASRSQDSHLADNPELMAVARHAEEVGRRAEAAYLSTNPELKAVRWHRAVSGDVDNSLSINPELAAYRRFVLDRES
jgi:hypothetical protein